jgi:pyruvate,water dikinase
MVRDDPSLAKLLQEGSAPAAGEFVVLVAEFLQEFGNLSFGTADDQQARQAIGKLLVQMASVTADRKQVNSADVVTLERTFLSTFNDDQEIFARELLDLARASYRTRDDDNIYLGRIEEQLQTSAREGLRRLALLGVALPDTTKPADIARAIIQPGYIPPLEHSRAEMAGKEHVRARQMTGQPAGPGLATAPARVILDPSDLANFRAGEIIVCDAIDPRMTIVIPIASGIVERRGGMLIHGAIIAREYGLPCVTGVPEVTTMINTGDSVTVDGYLGIVTVRRSADSTHRRTRKAVKA